jgi:uncharacterized protein YbbC (DUF1343 family)
MRHNQAAGWVFHSCLLALLGLVAVPAPSFGQNAPPQSKSAADLSALDSIVRQAVANDEIPGAVLLVEHRGRVLYRKAFGSRALIPQREPMTVDTIFDLASLTKPIATTSAVMKLVEQGKLRLNDPVARYIPEFAANGKDQITIRQLLTHTSGLRPDPVIPPGVSGASAVLQIIYADAPIAPPGMRFIYSDTGFVVLGELVHRVSGLTLDEFTAKHVFGPLGLRNTRFLPPATWKPRIAPTEEIDLPEGAKPGSGRGRVLRGEVHDPTSRIMDGVAGDAGLFSTSNDLAVFCRMLLAEGKVEDRSGQRLFAAATVRLMTTPQTPPWSPSLCGLGWDIDSSYSAPRGELFPLGSYGHTGFTGTSIWIDPASETFVILLANSVHPYRRPPISSLRSRVATAVAAALNLGDHGGFTSLLARSAGAERPYDAAGVYLRSDHTKTGIDVLEEENFAPLRGKRVGLITNQTGVDSQGRRTIDVLGKAEGVKLVALFTPEHGIAGKVDAKVQSGTDAATGLPVYSLYGETLRPTDEMLRGLDALVFDIQDAGVRFYTYIATMAYAMEEAARHKIAFFVLDRPNPLGGEMIEGPMLDRDRLSFTGYFPMPVRYAMTIGELAQMFNAENKIGAELHVIAMKDWRRNDLYETTGLTWIPPSPSLRTLAAALLYPGIEILQAGGVSVGRGTDTPLQLFGAPWIRGSELAQELNSRFVPGVRFVPTQFTPRDGLYKDQSCEGIALVITDRASLNSMLIGLEIAGALARRYPDHFALDKTVALLGSQTAIDRLKKGDAPTNIVADWVTELEAFRKLRAKYLLYPD